MQGDTASMSHERAQWITTLLVEGWHGMLEIGLLQQMGSCLSGPGKRHLGGAPSLATTKYPIWFCLSVALALISTKAESNSPDGIGEVPSLQGCPWRHDLGLGGQSRRRQATSAALLPASWQRSARSSQTRPTSFATASSKSMRPDRRWR